MGALVALVVVVAGCGRYSFAIRRQYDRGRYGAAVSSCESSAWAASQRWNPGHKARYHVYCGMAYLNLGDSQRAASELVQAEKMRLENPSLVTGRDLARLSQGLVRLFGVPAGQLEIEERPGQGSVAVGSVGSVAPPPPVTVVPPEAPEPPAPPVTSAPSVSFTAGAGVSGRASVTVVPPEPPEPPAPPAAPPAPPAAVDISAQPPAAPPPVIVIPAEDGVVIE